MASRTGPDAAQLAKAFQGVLTHSRQSLAPHVPHESHLSANPWHTFEFVDTPSYQD
jgi:hypothetical protein